MKKIILSLILLVLWCVDIKSGIVSIERSNTGDTLWVNITTIDTLGYSATSDGDTVKIIRKRSGTALDSTELSGSDEEIAGRYRKSFTTNTTVPQSIEAIWWYGGKIFRNTITIDPFEKRIVSTDTLQLVQNVNRTDTLTFNEDTTGYQLTGAERQAIADTNEARLVLQSSNFADASLVASKFSLLYYTAIRDTTWLKTGTRTLSDTTNIAKLWQHPDRTIERADTTLYVVALNSAESLAFVTKVQNVDLTDTSNLATLAGGQFTKISDTTWNRSTRTLTDTTNIGIKLAQTIWNNAGSPITRTLSDTTNIARLWSHPTRTLTSATNITSSGDPILVKDGGANDTVVTSATSITEADKDTIANRAARRAWDNTYIPYASRDADSIRIAGAVVTVPGSNIRTVNIDVKDSSNNNALATASVTTIQGVNKDVKTANASGRTTFSLPDGATTIHVNYAGYTFASPFSKTITQDTTFTFKGNAFTPDAPTVSNAGNLWFCSIDITSGNMVNGKMIITLDNKVGGSPQSIFKRDINGSDTVYTSVNLRETVAYFNSDGIAQINNLLYSNVLYYKNVAGNKVQPTGLFKYLVKIYNPDGQLLWSTTVAMPSQTSYRLQP